MRVSSIGTMYSKSIKWDIPKPIPVPQPKPEKEGKDEQSNNRLR